MARSPQTDSDSMWVSGSQCRMEIACENPEIVDVLRITEWQIVGQLRIVFRRDSHKSLDTTFFRRT